MFEVATILVVLHVTANMVWIGAIAAVAAILVAPSATADRNQHKGQLALHLYKRWATPAFTISFVLGVARLSLDLHGYFVRTHFMHGKLLFAFAVIGLHHVIGARAKKYAQAPETNVGAVIPLISALIICAAVAVYFAVFKPF